MVNEIKIIDGFGNVIAEGQQAADIYFGHAPFPESANKTFGQIEAVRRWDNKEKIECFCEDGGWFELISKEDWTLTLLPNAFKECTIFRIAKSKKTNQKVEE